jgi:hypothetical protein
MGRRKQSSIQGSSNENHTRKRDVKASQKGRPPNVKNSTMFQDLEAPSFSDNELGEIDDVEEDEDTVEKMDPRFKKVKNVIVYICLPSGQEEIMIDYEMCFVDR